MRKTLIFAVLFLSIQLMSCTNQRNSNIGSSSDFSSESISESKTLPNSIGNTNSQLDSASSTKNRITKVLIPKDKSKLSLKEKKYLNFICSIDIITYLAFSQPSDITQESAYYMYLIIKKMVGDENNINWTDQYYNNKNNLFIIPVSDIKQILKIYLNKEDFDPFKAFEKHIAKSPNEEGYHPETEEYYCFDPEGFGGLRNVGVTEFSELGNYTYEITVAFYFDKTYDTYKTQTLTIKESDHNNSEFVILKSCYKYYNDDGSVDIADSFEEIKDDSCFFN